MIYDGDFDQTEYLDGDFEEKTICDGDFGEVVMVSDLPEYDGPYEVVPTDEEQTIETSGQKMTENIVVKPIPENYGRLLWDGSRLRVY